MRGRRALTVMLTLGALGCGRINFDRIVSDDPILDGAASVRDASGGADAAVSTSADAGVAMDGGAPDGGVVMDGGAPDGGAPDGGVAPDGGPAPDTVVQLAVGQTATCVRLASGAVHCAGSNADGSLGRGSTDSLFEDPRLGPVLGVGDATDIQAGDLHFCVVRSAGDVSCWGWNFNGALGTGSTTPGTSGSPLDASELTGATRAHPGRTSTCAILPGGGVACVGSNESGELGDGTTVSRPTAEPVPGLGGVVALASGVSHHCSVHGDGTVRCWGWGSSGQLGNGTWTAAQPTPMQVTGIDDAVAIGAGTDHTCAVRSDGTLWCWGSNDSGQLGDGLTTYRAVPAIVPGLVDVVEVVAGYVHTCARTRDGRVHCFGWNGYGQLGDGTYDDSRTPVTVAAPADAVQIAAAPSADRTCALFAGGVVRCWGDNVGGAFGDGTTGGSPTPVAMLPPP